MLFERRIPEELRHAQAPGVRSVASLAATEAAARAILTSVFPVVMYQALGDARTVSEVYFLIGLVSMAAALLTPALNRLVPRRILYTLAVTAMICGNLMALTGNAALIPVALAINTIAVVVITVCFNAYVMDYVARASLGECETLRLFYSGAAWTIGPFLGVWLLKQWPPAPFVVSIAASCTLLAVFWRLRLGDGKVITRARRPAANPLAYLGRFFAQPRLIAGWTFAVIRSCGWWVYVVYLPIFAIENGYGEDIGGLALSITNACLFATPVMLRFMRGRGVRLTVITGFAGSAMAFAGAALFSGMPALVIGLLMIGSAFLILLDVSAGLPFLSAVKPSERTEMAAVYSTFRDVSGVVTPAAARLILAVMPLVGVFAATGLALAGCTWLALKLHPRLGESRLQRA